MYELICKNLITKQKFSIWKYDKWQVDAFTKKCSYSRKISILQTLKYN